MLFLLLLFFFLNTTFVGADVVALDNRRKEKKKWMAKKQNERMTGWVNELHDTVWWFFCFWINFQKFHSLMEFFSIFFLFQSFFQKKGKKKVLDQISEMVLYTKCYIKNKWKIVVNNLKQLMLIATCCYCCCCCCCCCYCWLLQTTTITSLEKKLGVNGGYIGFWCIVKCRHLKSIDM